MTLYSSGKNDHLTADLAAGCACGHCDYGCRFALMRPCCGACGPIDAPNADSPFDRPLTNPANPILAEFRIDPHLMIPERARDYLIYLVQHRSHVKRQFTDDQIAHACAVLTQLVNLAEQDH